MKQHRYSDRVLFQRLFSQARPYWPHIGALLVLNLLATPLTLLTPLPLKIAIDSVIGTRPPPGFLHAILPPAVVRSSTALLVLAIGIMVGVAVFSQVQALGIWMLQTYTGEKLVLNFRARLFRHVQRLSLAYHDLKGPAESTYRIQYDAPSIQAVAISGVMPLVSAVFTLVGMVCITARIDAQLAAVALAVVPVLLMVTHFYNGRLRGQWHEVKSLQSSALAVVQEVLSALRVVKAFGQEEREQQRFLLRSRESMGGQVRAAFMQGGFDLVVGFVMASGMAVTLFIGVLHVKSGALSLGELLVVIAYLTQLYEPLRTISKKTADLQASLAGAQRSFELLDQAPDVIERPHALALKRAIGSFEFQGVSFAYDGIRPVLHDVSLCVETGARVGIAGTSGAGKTTLVNLITRFYDPTGGQILLDGIELRDYKLADLRSQFGIVLQEPVLFSASIAENIAYARPDANEDEVIAAAEAANAHAFIVALPNGYDTQVGERGVRLSGGERQRISLARAFLKDAPVLVLDEPTSSVDVRTEAAIMEAMERLMHGKTTFMIAHRLSTLQNCDVVVIVENGRLRPVTAGTADGIGQVMERDMRGLAFSELAGI